MQILKKYSVLGSQNQSLTSRPSFGLQYRSKKVDFNLYLNVLKRIKAFAEVSLVQPRMLSCRSQFIIQFLVFGRISDVLPSVCLLKTKTVTSQPVNFWFFNTF